MKFRNRLAACLVVSVLAGTTQADLVPPEAFGLYSGTGKATSLISTPSQFKVTYFLQIIDASTAELVLVQEGQTPSDPVPGNCHYLEPGHLLLKFPTSPGSTLSGTFILKGKAGKFSIKGTMNTLVEGYIGTIQIPSKFKQNPI